jgi:hypothetical protein
VWPEATSRLDQLITARSLVWVIVLPVTVVPVTVVAIVVLIPLELTMSLACAAEIAKALAAPRSDNRRRWGKIIRTLPVH